MNINSEKRFELANFKIKLLHCLIPIESSRIEHVYLDCLLKSSSELINFNSSFQHAIHRPSLVKLIIRSVQLSRVTL